MFKSRTSSMILAVTLCVAPLAWAEESPKAPEDKWRSAVSSINPLERKIDEQLQAENTRRKDPLKFLADDMGNVVVDLSAYRTNRPVQVKEEQVVAQLEKIIEELEKACNGSGGGRSPNPSRPAGSSSIANGPGGGELNQAKEGGQMVVALPPKVREQILQSRTEGFPPGYESLLQSYYQRLSQERVTGDAASPTTAPANE